MDVALFVERLTVRFHERIISGFYLALLGYLVAPFYVSFFPIVPTNHDPSYSLETDVNE